VVVERRAVEDAAIREGMRDVAQGERARTTTQDQKG